MLVVVGVNYFFPRQQPVEQQEVTVIKGSADGKITTEEIAQVEKTDEQNIAAEPVYENVEEVLQKDARLPVENNAISGSIRLKGARFDNILLSKYKQTLDADSGDVELMAPAKTKNAFFGEKFFNS